MGDGNYLHFEPTLGPPNRFPLDRLHFPIGRSFTLLGCRHGFLFMLHTSQGTLELLVCNPVNSYLQPIAIPPGFGKKSLINGAVLRAALGDTGHFKVILISTDDDEQGAVACVYSSEPGVWGNLITTPLPPYDIYPAVIDPYIPAVLVGDCIYMLLLGESSSIVEFNVDRQSLAVIPLPVGLHSDFSRYSRVMRAEGGGLGLLFVSTSGCSAQLWKRKTDCDGVASWVLGRTIELGKLLSLDLQNPCGVHIQGFAEENNVVFLWTFGGLFMVQLDSLQFKEIPEINLPHWHPFEIVYGAGI